MALNKNKGVTEILGNNEKKLNNTQQRKQILPKLLYWQNGSKLLQILPGLLLAGGATAGINYLIKNTHSGYPDCGNWNQKNF